MEKRYKTTEFIIDGVRVLVHDPSSNEARQERFEKACARFMRYVLAQKEKPSPAIDGNSKNKTFKKE